MPGHCGEKGGKGRRTRCTNFPGSLSGGSSWEAARSCRSAPGIQGETRRVSEENRFPHVRESILRLGMVQRPTGYVYKQSPLSR